MPLVNACRTCYRGNMPEGKHTGQRSMITLPKHVDSLYAELAGLLGKPKATIMAMYLVELTPVLEVAVNALKAGDISQDELRKRFGAVLVDLLVGSND